MFNKYVLGIGILLAVQSCSQISSSGDTSDTHQATAAPTPAQQAGERIYQQQCQVCHGVKERKSGPALAGVRERWAGAEDELVAFIRNSKAYLETGQGSKVAYAKALYEAANRMVMPPANLTDTEIDHLLQYVDYASQ